MQGNFASRDAGSFQTGIAIANPTDNPIQVNLSLTPLNSSLRPVGSVAIPAHGQFARYLNEIPGLSSVPVPFEGVLSVQSPVPISVDGMFIQYNERGDFLADSTLPVSEGSSSPASMLFIPHFVDSAGFTTRFIVFSTDDTAPSPGFVTVFADSGNNPQFGAGAP